MLARIVVLVKAIKEGETTINPIDWIQENTAAVLAVSILMIIAVVMITLLSGQC